jgi:3-hydroxyacyl-CoA dehydrogenase
MIDAELYNMKKAQFVTEHDAFLAGRIAYVLSGGDIQTGGLLDEDAMLALERQAFIDFLKNEKTMARIEHMLKTGKPLRN